MRVACDMAFDTEKVICSAAALRTIMLLEAAGHCETGAGAAVAQYAPTNHSLVLAIRPWTREWLVGAYCEDKGMLVSRGVLRGQGHAG